MRFLMHEYRFPQEILLHGEQASEKKKKVHQTSGEFLPMTQYRVFLGAQSKGIIKTKNNLR